MIINLTKLLDVKKYQGIYGETSWVGYLENGTSENQPYAFELDI